MRYLVDANVLSELTKPAPTPQVVDWFADHETDIAVDPFILGEIRFGIMRMPKGRNRRELEAWFEGGVARLTCLPWDHAHGIRWAALLAELRTKGRQMPIVDSLIATTALVAGLTVVTRNVSDFSAAGVPALDPFPAGHGATS